MRIALSLVLAEMATSTLGRWTAAGATPRWQRIAALLLVAFSGAATLLMAGTMVTYAVVGRTLPSPAAIGERHAFQSTKIFDRNGVLLHEVYDPNKGRRVSLQLNEVPEQVRKTFLAAEDARFYENSGVDVFAIIRAAFKNARGEQVSGGSTITQQLVKMTLLSDERTIIRKIKEAMLAIKISRTFTKDQILELYLNTAYFGNQAYGVESAAETYFAKPAAELTQAEAALLAGLVRSPSSTNPFKDQTAAKGEQKRVLDQMVRHRMVTAAEAEELAAEPLNFNTKQFAELKAPHFAIWIREQLEQNPKYGAKALYQDGIEVTTTLDYRMQEMAELLVKQHVAQLGRLNVTDGALVAMNPATGEILAMVGSADYNNKDIKGEVNVALALRQPGSSIKPITYVTAFQKGWTPGTIIEDTPTSFPQGPGMPPYTPRNYDGTFRGKVTARQALAMSLNIPAVKTLQFVGVPAMMENARKMGIQSFQDPTKYGLALTLGGGEVRLLDHTAAYGVFANQGKYVAPVAILKVTDTNGKVLDEWIGPKPQQVIDPGRAYMITNILKDNDARAPAFGAFSPLRLTRPAAVKTGTTDDFKDNWTMGYTSQLVVGVWVGNADNSQMRGTTGITGAAPIWHDYMEYALGPLPVDPLNPPEGLVKVKVDRQTGKLWQEGCGGEAYEDYFAPGTEPKEKCEPPTPPPASPTPNEEQRKEIESAQATSDALKASQAATESARTQPTQPPSTQSQPTQAPATQVQPTQAPAPTQPPAPTARPQPTTAPPQAPAPTQPPAPTATQQRAAPTSTLAPQPTKKN